MKANGRIRGASVAISAGILAASTELIGIEIAQPAHQVPAALTQQCNQTMTSLQNPTRMPSWNC